jgi:hypothetical protein
MNRTITGAIASGDEIDFFAFHNDSRVRDILQISVMNQSTTLVPNIQLYDHNKAAMPGGTDTRTPGANAELLFSADPGQDYYFSVSGRYWPGYGSTGNYKLEVVPQKAFDEYEPNDDAFSATPLRTGQTVIANIMDDKDVDWYRLSGVTKSKVNLRIENLSTTLVPNIQLYDHNKASLPGTDARTAGANTEFSFSTQPGQEYYVVVTGQYWPGYPSKGKYKLSVSE